MAEQLSQMTVLGDEFDVRQDAPLGRVGWFQAGGTAQYLFKANDVNHLKEFLRHSYDPQTERSQYGDVHVFGVLSNTIIRDAGLKGLTIRLGRGFSELKQIDDVTIYAGAKALDKSLARFAGEAGIDGLSFYSGIPGTIGGALKMNAGCYGTETKDVLVEAYGVTLSGEERTFTPQDLQMRYRHTQLPPDVIMTGALFRGRVGDKDIIQAEMAAMQKRREDAQPIREKTGGSTFANPDPDQLKAAGLPIDMKTWQLIDGAGGRGLRIGGAIMSEKHCNFMINTDGASARDLENLGEEIRRRVRETYGVELRWEIRRLGGE